MDKNKQSTKSVNIFDWCGKEQYGVFDASASITHGVCQKWLVFILENKGSSSSDSVS